MADEGRQPHLLEVLQGRTEAVAVHEGAVHPDLVLAVGRQALLPGPLLAAQDYSLDGDFTVNSRPQHSLNMFR